MMILRLPAPLVFVVAAQAATLDLAGSWEVSLADPAAAPAWQPMQLPGTLDEAGLEREPG